MAPGSAEPSRPRCRHATPGNGSTSPATFAPRSDGASEPPLPAAGAHGLITAWDVFDGAWGLDIGEGIACKVIPYTRGDGVYRGDMAGCFLATATGRTPDGPGWGSLVNWAKKDANGYNSIPGGTIKSISVSAPKPADAAVFMLGSDNKLRVATGSTTASWYTTGYRFHGVANAYGLLHTEASRMYMVNP